VIEVENVKEARIVELRVEIEDLKRKLSANRHKPCATKMTNSEPPELLMQLEELEEELKRLENTKG
jgi:hypothetical protein